MNKNEETYPLDGGKWQSCLYSHKMHMPKNLESVPAQVLTQLRHYRAGIASQ